MDCLSPSLSVYDAEQIARSHHERWGGGGYPDGLAGEDIPEPARIVAVIDVYDALVNKRVYREALPEEQALELMSTDREKQFDPEVFDCFQGSLPVLREIREETTSSVSGLAP